MEFDAIRAALPQQVPFVLVDRVVAYVAPALLGAGPAALGDVGVGTMSGIRRLQVDDVARTGEDVRLVLRPQR